ncbi:MAG: pyridoxal phosphate-dependent aminotransferase [Acidimicrobiales bacterium]|nr:aminotransferase class I/II-fold pyridoxal phosphate-dependent enzyme [Actinomycetes bacterium]MDP6287929.1 pyridoxal phosphate-dependent aminotransferase [Acidimicrobiales bacterium]MDP6911368.1 pyridoxal phosphate-dependent aminotransferase [Acidimicrobiales bacterium]HJP24429.1 pyridoxal phosphate-dependent aminotransferase [Acidimicrobiales bacterium]
MTSVPEPTGFVPPPYPFDVPADVVRTASAIDGGAVDLSRGVPCDPVPDVVAAALAEPDSARPYPPSVGTPELLDAVAGWCDRQLGVPLDPLSIGACVGTKEMVTGLPHLLRLRNPERDTVLYPAVSYPSYEMGAILAGCRAVPVPMTADWRIDLSAIDENDASRALCLWVNTPGNPAGALDDLGAAAEWGRGRGVPVVSDECYVEFTWHEPSRSVLQHGLDGVLAVHSLSKRSNLAGLRVGFYAGDPDLVWYLRETRRHQGFLIPGPAQAAGAASLRDQDHVQVQAGRYRRRLESLIEVLAALGLSASMPEGGFYLWITAPDGDELALTRSLARELGILTSPGTTFGPDGAGHVRIAAVVPDEQLALVRARAGLT